jgi:hypothetical protein
LSFFTAIKNNVKKIFILPFYVNLGGNLSPFRRLTALGFETETTRSDAGSGLEATEDRLDPAAGWDPGLVLSDVFSTPLSLLAFAGFFLLAPFCSFIKLQALKNEKIENFNITKNIGISSQ